MAPEGPSRFKSRFSLLSLLPLRHPPLIVGTRGDAAEHSDSHYPPLPPPPATRAVASHHAVRIDPPSPIVSHHASPSDTPTPCLRLPSALPVGEQQSAASAYSPIYAARSPAYTLNAYLESWSEEDSGDNTEWYSSISTPRPYQLKKKRLSPRRPPPLDLSRTHAAFPSVRASLIPIAHRPQVVLPSEADTTAVNTYVEPIIRDPIPSLAPGRQTGKVKKTKSKKDHKAASAYDPFDVVEVEVGHRYPSWQGGKFNLKPGDVAPPGSLWQARAESSALHDVLLTPAYRGRTSSAICSGSASGSPRPLLPGRRTTFIEALHTAAKRGSRWLGPMERSLRALREREERDMDRYRREMSNMQPNAKVISLAVPGHGWASATESISPAYARRSPGAREWDTGISLGKHSANKHWWSHDAEKDKKRHKFRKYVVIIVILCLAALAVGLCTSLLTRSSTSTANETDSSSTSAVGDSASFAAPSASATASTAISDTLATCLSTFSSSSSSASSFPCSNCVPLLSSTVNDFNLPLVGANSTGVGAALQFCSLMDILDATEDGTDLTSWGDSTDPCTWSGVACDTRGRITEVTLKYPAVPDSFTSTLANIISLQSLHVLGNSSIPSGPLPPGILSLSNLTTLDLEYTALTGPLASTTFSSAAALETLLLINNGALGVSLPDLSMNTRLVTLAVTDQGLNSLNVSDLPASLTYLDLSYNDLGGQIPSFSTLTVLETLYLESNEYTASPSSLPSSLSTLSFTDNTALSGVMPSAICESSVMANCDLRDTNITANATSTLSTSSSSTITVGVSESPRASSMTSSSTTASASTTPSCGVCKFT